MITVQDLERLPTETLESLAALTRRLRAEQHLRALPTPMLRDLLLVAEQNQHPEILALVRAELTHR